MISKRFWTIVLVFSSCSSASDSSEDLTGNILCQARKEFNREIELLDNQYGHPIFTQYIGFDMRCSTEPIESISSTDNDYRVNYEYNEQNKLTKYEQITPAGDVNLTTFKYDAAGNLIEMIEPEGTWEFEYDTSNYATVSKRNGKVFYRTKIDGLVVTHERYSTGGMIESVIKKHYDKTRRLVMTEFLNPNDTTDFQRFKLYYDDRGNIQKNVFEEFGKTRISFRDYNALGLITRDSMISGDKPVLTLHIKYEMSQNDDEYTIKQEQLGFFGKITTCVFDKNGNLISKKDNGIPKTEEERKITYR